jgi:MipA family protein
MHAKTQYRPGAVTGKFLNPIRRLTFCIGAWFALAAATPALAQDADKASNNLPLWEAGVVAGALSTPSYPGSNQPNRRALVLPYFIYRGEILRANRGGMGARLAHSENWEVDVGFTGSLPANSNDIELRQGMPDLGTLLEFGPRLKVLLAQPSSISRVTLEVPVRTVLELNDGVRQVGNVLEPKIAYEREIDGNWYFKTAFSVIVGDSQLNQYFYGVSASQATSVRPAYTAQGGLIGTRLTLDGSKSLGPDVRLFGYVRYDMHGGAANRASPLFAQDTGTTAGIGLVWTLGRSSTRVADDL